jgi:hypothetical protein
MDERRFTGGPGNPPFHGRVAVNENTLGRFSSPSGRRSLAQARPGNADVRGSPRRGRKRVLQSFRPVPGLPYPWRRLLSACRAKFLRSFGASGPRHSGMSSSPRGRPALHTHTADFTHIADQSFRRPHFCRTPRPHPVWFPRPHRAYDENPRETRAGGLSFRSHARRASGPSPLAGPSMIGLSAS